MSSNLASPSLEPRHFAVVLDAVSDGVFTIDRDHVITSFNRSAEQITGLQRHDVLGRRCCDVFHAPACRTREDCPLTLALRTGCLASNREATIPTARGDNVRVHVSFRALRGPDGQIVGGVETFRPLPPTAPAGLSAADAAAGLPILEASERRAIAEVLRRHGGSRSAAAEELGISRVTLWRKIRRLGIDP